MSLHTSETESENETLSALFSKGLSIHDSVCADEGDTNSATFQEKVRKGIMILEDATRLVSILDLFSRNDTSSYFLVKKYLLSYKAYRDSFNWMEEKCQGNFLALNKWLSLI